MSEALIRCEMAVRRNGLSRLPVAFYLSTFPYLLRSPFISPCSGRTGLSYRAARDGAAQPRLLYYAPFDTDLFCGHSRAACHPPGYDTSPTSLT